MSELIETIYHVYEPCGRGEHLAVRPWPEAPNTVNLVTIGDSNMEYFGKIDIAMSPEYARALAACLIKCAEDLENENG